ncbi:MAG: radical SAM/SPASM domain-containing protein [Thermoleophilia bacterium]
MTETTPTGPLYINVEPTNACNLQCYTCSIDGTRKRGFMDMDLFRKIIDQAPESGVYEVALFMGGEPLLHKDLSHMVEYVVSRGLEARIYTNACLLTRDKSEALLDAGLSFLGVSIDGDSKEEYESMRIGANFEKVIGNLISFLELKKERGFSKPYVSLQMIKLLENPNQEITPEFKAQFDGLPLDEFSIRNPHDWRGEKTNIKLKEQGQHYFPCQVFWSAMSIAWDGRVVGCSADLNGKFILGDLRTQSIMEVWNGESMKQIRRLLKKKRYMEVPLCAQCHGLWMSGHPRLSLLSQLPPFEQMRKGVRLVLPNKRRDELENTSPGAIRSKK